MKRKHKDTLRLDRLNRNPAKSYNGTWSFTPQCGGGVYVWETPNLDVPSNGIFFKSIRAALDADERAEAAMRRKP